MGARQVIPAGGGAGLRLARGEQCGSSTPRLGRQATWWPSRKTATRISTGRSFDYGGKIYVSTGDVLWSDLSNPMLTIVADEVGRHDFLYAPCSLEMYRIQYQVTGYHPNCNDNLTAALRELGIQPGSLPTALNFFMNVDIVEGGRLVFAPPKSRAGDSMVLRAEMDLALALTACPTSTCNGGAPARPLEFEVLAGWVA